MLKYIIKKIKSMSYKNIGTSYRYKEDQDIVFSREKNSLENIKVNEIKKIAINVFNIFSVVFAALFIFSFSVFFIKMDFKISFKIFFVTLPYIVKLAIVALAFIVFLIVFTIGRLIHFSDLNNKKRLAEKEVEEEFLNNDFNKKEFLKWIENNKYKTNLVEELRFSDKKV
jgi:energy-coupling factor transporter transmembrane protein EcfT